MFEKNNIASEKSGQKYEGVGTTIRKIPHKKKLRVGARNYDGTYR